ncbi:hypothetical protein ACWGR4_40550 [Embleya sp. NPDC055664]
MTTSTKTMRWSTVGVALAALLITGTGTAHAGLRQYQDGFESNPSGKWIRETVGNAATGFDFGLNNARSGSNNGWLNAGTQGFAAEGIWVSTGDAGASDCAAQVFANPLNDRSREITVGVWDSSGNLIDNITRNLSFTGYQRVQSNPFRLYGYQSVFVRFTVSDSGRGYDGEWVRLDDFTLTCTW